MATTAELRQQLLNAVDTGNMNALSTCLLSLTTAQKDAIGVTTFNHVIEGIANYSSINQAAATAAATTFMSTAGSYASTGTLSNAMLAMSSYGNTQGTFTILDNVTSTQITNMSSADLGKTLYNLATTNASNLAGTAEAVQHFMVLAGTQAGYGYAKDALINLAQHANFDGVGAVLDNLSTAQWTNIGTATTKALLTSYGITAGSNSNDSITGTSGADNIYGLSGDDTLNGGAGNDRLYGGKGNDTLYGGTGTNYINGGDGNDTIYTHHAAYSTDIEVIEGGAGTDTLNYSGATAGVTVGLSSGFQNTVGAGYQKISGIENIVGSNYRDYFVGNSSLKSVNGVSGSDTLSYNNSAVTAGVNVDLSITAAQNTGGAGTMAISNIEQLEGSRFNDTLKGDANSNLLQGKGGNDVIYGGDGDDTIDGDFYSNASTLGDGNDTLYGGNGNDTLSGGGGVDYLDGGAGNDTFYLAGSGARQTIVGGAGVDKLYSNAGVDKLYIDLNVTSAQDTGGAGTLAISGVENIDGTKYNDYLIGDANANEFYGQEGDDVLYGKGGDDRLNGSLGNDIIYAGTGNNFLYGGDGDDQLITDEYGAVGTNYLDGGNGNDLIVNGNGNDTVIGGAGIDTLVFDLAATSPSAVTVDLSVTTAQNTGGAGTDTITGIENITGTRFNDVIRGSAVANQLEGYSGNDSISGGAGDDTLFGDFANGEFNPAYDGWDSVFGDDGNDYIYGGGGNDYLVGGLGNDTIYGGSGDDSITGDQSGGARGNNTIYGGDGNDKLNAGGGSNYVDGGTGNDTIYSGAAGMTSTIIGGTGTDTIDYNISYVNESAGTLTVNLGLTTAQNTGTAGMQTISGVENLRGSLGNDTLIGDANNNNLYGHTGSDTLSGGAGNDVLRGGLGSSSFAPDNDILSGGAGSDTFVFDSLYGVDRVTDFKASEGDKLNFHEILTGYDPLQNKITDFISARNDGTGVILSVDRDGMGTAAGKVDIARLDNTTNLNVLDLFNQGKIET